ncbi:hypothetical protein TNCV_1570771 [Trichonephila clavipes]|uniref:Uncharacterized protein n=1 Tax=Trichonephila clavipes TaxID=2585209 RepID=A0A8X6SKU0_TRICX|nr:hypothetical protein TNCV_1570771 [Trichonephila clavipes]
MENSRPPISMFMHYCNLEPLLATRSPRNTVGLYNHLKLEWAIVLVRDLIVEDTGETFLKGLHSLVNFASQKRMDEARCRKKIFLTKPMGNRPRGRTPARWIDCVEKDLNILKVKNLKTVAKNRDACRKLLEKASH